MRVPREVKIYFIAVVLILVSFVTMYHEMVRMHEVAHQEAFAYFGINSTVVFYSPFTAQTIAAPGNLTADDSRFLYFIQSLNEQGTTILLVEQNAREALRISRRAYVMDTGRILLTGTGEELLKNEEVKRAFLGKDYHGKWER